MHLCGKGYLMSKAVVKFTGSIHEHSVWKLITNLDILVHMGVEQIDLIISSTGGNTRAALNVFNQLQALQRMVNITAYNSSICHSAAFTLFLGVDDRKSAKNTSFMFHQLITTFNNAVTESEIFAEAESARLTNQKYIEIITERTDIKDVEQHYKQTYFFDENEAIKNKVINEIVEHLPVDHEYSITIHGFENGNINYHQIGLD